MLSLHSLHSFLCQVKHYDLIFLREKKRFEADAEDDGVHIKGARALSLEGVALDHSQEANCGGISPDARLIQKSSLENSRKQKTSNGLVCLEFPPSASVGSLGVNQNVL
jgi:hypothetical protein